MPVRGLTLVVAGPDPGRFTAALRLAATAAAVGGRTRLFLDEAAVALFPAAAGEPLLAACLELGVGVELCQGGLAAAGLDLRALDPRLEGGGLAGLLAGLDDDRLVVL